MEENLSVSMLSAPERWDKASRCCELAKEDSRAGCEQMTSEKSLCLQVQSWVLSEDSILSDQLCNYKKIHTYFTHTHAL